MRRAQFRRVLPLAAAFLGGFTVAGLAANSYLSSSPSSMASTAVQLPERGEGQGRGEIAVSMRNIMDRVSAARVPSTRLRGGIDIRLTNVLWRDGPNRPFLRATAVRGVLNISGAERGDIIVDGLIFTNANVLLQQARPGGQWNYERVLADLLEDDDDDNGNGNGNGGTGGGSRRTVLFSNTRFIDSRVEVRQPTQDMAFEDLDALAASIELSSPRVRDPEIQLTRLATEYVDLRKRDRLAVLAENAHLRFPDNRVDFNIERGTLGTTRLASLSGTWEPSQPGLGLAIEGRAIDVQLSELAFVSDRLPREGTGTFNFAVRTLGEESMDVQLSNADLRTQGSHITGALSMRTGAKELELRSVNLQLQPLSLALVEQLTGSKLPYGGTLTGTASGNNGNLTFGVDAELTAEGLSRPFETRLDGALRLAQGEFSLQRLQAQLTNVPAAALRPIASGLPFSGNINGTITLTGPPNRAPLTLDVALALAGGTVNVAGTLDLTGAEPAYDLSGRLAGLQLDDLLQPELPPVVLVANFTLNGRGTKPELANARFSINGGLTGWRSATGDTVLVSARVSSGTLEVDTGVVFVGPVRLSTAGQWRFTAPESGALRYQVAITDLTAVQRYLPLANDSAGGSIRGEGTLAGSLNRYRIEGTLEGKNVHLAKWGASTLAFKHALALGDSVPEIKVEGNAENVTTPTTGEFSTVTLNLELSTPVFAMDLKADRVQGGVVEVLANGTIPYRGARRLVLERVRADLGTGRWVLARPSAIEWGNTGGGVDVRNFEMRVEEGVGLLRLDGRILPLAQINARLETEALPLADVWQLLGNDTTLTGGLWAKAEVRGPGEAPTADIEFHVDTGSYEGVAFSRMEGAVKYSGQLMTGNARVTFDTAGALNMRASLPMHVAFAPEVDFDLLDSGSVSGELVSEGITLSSVAGFFRDVDDVQGVLRANATLSGTVVSPILAGAIVVDGGALTVVPFDRRYTDISADITFDAQRAQIRSVRARSDGWLEATGYIDFPEIKNPIVNLTATLEGFRVAGVENRQDAAARGAIHLTGPVLNAPVVSGSVTFEDGDLPVPQLGGTSLDATLAELAEPIEVEQPNGTPSGGSFYDKLRIDSLTLRAGDGLWFSMRNARAQLAGTLTIDKPGEDLIILGTLEGRRGTYTLEAGPVVRRFEIVNAQVSFLGTPEINPRLDITARRVIVDNSGREMDIQVRVGGTLDNPTLSLASQNAAQIPQSELLSFLLFGQPTQTLGGRYLPGESLIEETFFSGFAELAALEIENALGQPFDMFQIRLGGGRYGGLATPTLLVGREIKDNVYLTVESGLAALFGPNGDGNVANTWAVRLEWRIDPRTSLRAGYEPVNRSSLVRGVGIALPVNRRQQGTLEFRKRWTW